MGVVADLSCRFQPSTTWSIIFQILSCRCDCLIGPSHCACDRRVPSKFYVNPLIGYLLDRPPVKTVASPLWSSGLIQRDLQRMY